VQAPPIVTCGPPTDAGIPDSACNTIACGPPVAEQYVPGDIPAPIGGTIPDGTYALTALNNYGSGKTGPTGNVLQASYRYEGTHYDEAQTSGTIDGGLGSVARISGSFTTSDKTVSWSATCNIGGIPVGYSYIDGTVRHYFVNQEYVYTRQQ